MTHDPIADMLTRMRNALAQRHKYVDVRLSKLNGAILKVLQEEGLIEKFFNDEDNHMIRVFLKYDNNRNALISQLKRMSSPGRRLYVQWPDVPIVRKGLGMAIVSTSQGVMNGNKARIKQVGGELLCCVW